MRIDSREIEPGDVFIALSGSIHDGHDYAELALRQGASLLIVREDQAAGIPGPKLIVPETAQALTQWAGWHRQQSDALVIGVTGSVGKTTTRELIHSALCGSFPGTRSRKNYNNDLGVPLSLLDIQPEHEFAVLELGASRRGEIARLSELAGPEIGVVTAIGSAHVESFGSLDGVMQAKGELIESLPSGGFAILNGDCPHLRSLARRATCRVIFVGEQLENHCRATAVAAAPEALEFQCDGRRFRVPIFGRHQLSNVLCAIAIGREFGIASAVLVDSLAEFQSVPGRSQVRRIGCWTVIDDSYNASPSAFTAAVNGLAEFPLPAHAQRIAVAGDMLELGDSATVEHFQLGRLLADAGIDRVLITGRFADDVARGAMSAGMSSHNISVARDWDTLLFLLECWLEPDDVVLVKGSRGLRMERIVTWLENSARQPREQQWVFAVPSRKSA